MKPREIWIPDDIVERLGKVPIAPMLRSSKFREVVPIDWDDIWKKYHKALKERNMSGLVEICLEQLVEKALENGND